MFKDQEQVKASISILVDNTIMELIPDSKMIKRLSMPNKSFIAEHGFSALIEVEGSKILVDTGATGIALEHNLNLLGFTLEDIDVVFISHGHSDHTGGVHKFAGRVVAHPDSFYRKYLVPGKDESYDLTSPNADTMRQRAEFHREPVKLARGVITTGEIPRVHEWEELDIFRMKKNGKMIRDRLLDDQGVIINTSKGLVIVSGCGHSGIINTIEYARGLTGVDDVYCVIGGFHLIGPGEAKIDRTINELKRLEVKKIVPMHCTGFEGIKRMSSEMPEEFEYGTTGCRLSV